MIKKVKQILSALALLAVIVGIVWLIAQNILNNHTHTGCNKAWLYDFVRACIVYRPISECRADYDALRPECKDVPTPRER